MSVSAPNLLGLGQVSLLVRDIVRATRFYAETLGLRHLYTFGDLAFFDTGGTRLYLHRRDDAEWLPGSILYFTVADIHAAQVAIASAGVGFKGNPRLIHRHEDGTEEWMTFFEDSEGNALALMSSVVSAT